MPSMRQASGLPQRITTKSEKPWPRDKHRRPGNRAYQIRFCISCSVFLSGRRIKVGVDRDEETEFNIRFCLFRFPSFAPRSMLRALNLFHAIQCVPSIRTFRFFFSFRFPKHASAHVIQFTYDREGNDSSGFNNSTVTDLLP